MPLTLSVITFNHTHKNTACTPNVTNKSSMCNLLKFQFQNKAVLFINSTYVCNTYTFAHLSRY